MTARVLASPAAEIRRLRADLAEARGLLAALLDALPDPAAELRYRQALCREAAEVERDRARSEGYAQAIADIKRAEHDMAHAVHLAGRRADPGGAAWLDAVARHHGTEYGGDGRPRVTVPPEVIARARRAA